MQTTVRIGTIILSLGLVSLALVARVGGEQPTLPAPTSKGASNETSGPYTDGKEQKDPGPKRIRVNLKHAQRQLDLEWAELIQTKKDLQETERRIREKLKEFQAAKSSADSYRKNSIKSQKNALEQNEKKGKARLKDLQRQQRDLEEKLRRQRGDWTGSGTPEAKFQQKINRLTEICEKMPPDAAARILESLKLKVATAIIARMKVRRAAAVMSNLSVETAAKISERYLKNDFSPPPPKPKKRRN